MAIGYKLIQRLYFLFSQGSFSKEKSREKTKAVKREGILNFMGENE